MRAKLMRRRRKALAAICVLVGITTASQIHDASSDHASAASSEADPRSAKRGFERLNDRIDNPLVHQLLAGDKAQREASSRQLERELSGMAEPANSPIIVELIRIVANPWNQVHNPSGTHAVIKLLGHYGGARAVPYLVAYMTYPEHLPCLGFDDVSPCNPFMVPGSYLYNQRITNDGMANSIAVSCPCVPALIQIGAPAIDAVARELSTAHQPLRMRCCLKVLKELEKRHLSARAAIAKAIEKTWAASDADRIVRYATILESDPEIGLHDEKWRD